jgi:hypothetical protein
MRASAVSMLPSCVSPARSCSVAAADVVAVLGQVGQVAEVGEGADHAHRFGGAQALEQVLQRAVGGLVGVAAEGHRQRADRSTSS